ncbi:MAG: hypothetical protein M1358_18670 [Chloroflexi bacterium]|nr:hypothetical protein [Chloroflexota bacterium]
MPRTITIDGIQVSQIRLIKDPNGQFYVYAEYQLKSGSQMLQGKYEDIGGLIGAQRKAAAAAVFDGIVQDLTSQMA